MIEISMNFTHRVIKQSYSFCCFSKLDAREMWLLDDESDIYFLYPLSIPIAIKEVIEILELAA